jgi:hypothetical protein
MGGGTLTKDRFSCRTDDERPKRFEVVVPSAMAARAVDHKGLTIFFFAKPARLFSLETSKIDRLMPIVSETRKIADRRNPPLNSRAQISDGSVRRLQTVFLVQ